jgi:ABC-type Mn2+/Zn2+ transport system ATPase subunit
VRVDIEGVYLSRGGRRILRDVSVAIPSGARVTITGVNGAGKTTLVKAIVGLLPVSDGTIDVGANRVGSRSWRSARRAVGYVGQHAVQTDFPIAAMEVVAIGCIGQGLSRSGRTRRMRESMAATASVHLWNTPYQRLSGGEKQRVSIARCLCQNPEVLLLDEPTAGLDPEGKDALLDLVDRLSEQRGATVLLVTHESAHFDRPGWGRIEMVDGRIGSATIGPAGDGARRFFSSTGSSPVAAAVPAAIGDGG